MDAEEFAERVLRAAESVPPGRATSYGRIAAAIGVGGPRTVGAVMARDGSAVPWWRVVRADGSLPEALRTEALAHWLEEGTPLRSGRVDLSAAGWDPPPSRL